jgi:hypothetical protein
MEIRMTTEKTRFVEKKNPLQLINPGVGFARPRGGL